MNNNNQEKEKKNLNLYFVVSPLAFTTASIIRCLDFTNKEEFFFIQVPAFL